MATYMVEIHVPEALRGFVAALAGAEANIADSDLSYALNCETVPVLIQAETTESLDRKLEALSKTLAALGVPDPIFTSAQEIS